MKNTTFRKKALLSSVAMLLVALVALGSATFAWFSTKTTADAHTLSANTTQGTNLQISESKTDGWTQDLTFTNDSTTKLDPVTPSDADLTTWQTAKADKWDDQKAGTNEGNALAPAAEVGYVLRQKVYVRYKTDSGSFNLNVTPTITVNGGTQDYYRVAFVPVTDEENVDTATDAATKVYANGNNITDGVILPYTATDASSFDLGKISAGSIYAYDVVIWFEGHDLDCDDSHSTNNISLSLQFGGTTAAD